MSGPLPPIELAERVGGLVVDRGDHDAYLQFGAIARQRIESLLPADWTWDGKRLLDFGCGAGRTLRHFLPEAGRVELWGCDIDEPSIRWLRENLSPPINAFVNGEAPPLPQPDRFFHVICAISVFTHITDQWSAWLLELHRVLADDGIVIATILAEGMSQCIAGEPWDPDRVGMNVMTAGEDWDRGGPNVFLSPWWIRAHWGRAFEILMLDPGVKAGVQGIVAMRRKPVTLTREDLERPEPGEPREEAALRHQVRQLFEESATLRRYANEATRLLEHERPARAAAEHERDGLRHQLAAAAHESDELRRRLAAAAHERAGAHRQLEKTERERDELRQRLANVEGSRSWRLTAPLRRARRRVWSRVNLSGGLRQLLQTIGVFRGRRGYETMPMSYRRNLQQRPFGAETTKASHVQAQPQQDHHDSRHVR